MFNAGFPNDRVFNTGLLNAGLTAIAALLLLPAGVHAQGTQATAGRPTFQDNRRWTPRPEPALTVPPAGSAAAANPATASPRSSLPDGANTSAGPSGNSPGGPGACGTPLAKATPLEAGRMHIALTSACRGGQEMLWTYGGAEFEAKLDSAGRAEFEVDAFAGTTTPVEIKFADSTVLSLPVQAMDLDKVSKIAVIWRAPVNLDLQAFEYAALAGQAGHVSAATPSTLEATRTWIEKSGRGHGYLSTNSTSRGDAGRDRLAVYTFLHKDGQAFGLVMTALEHASRSERPGGATCGAGARAEVPFRTVASSRHGHVVREAGVFAAAECGRDLPQAARANTAALPTIRIRN